MKKISILDCTLRDGGYVNNFAFGSNVIAGLLRGLSKASINIIECGFLREGEYNPDRSIFSSVDDISKALNESRIGGQRKSGKFADTLYVAMIQYGAIKAADIPQCDGSSVDGIRLTFHEHEIEAALKEGRILKDKGYKVFMQPVGTTSYSDVSLIKLLDEINALRPYAFYIVDTLGKMYKKDLMHIFYLVDHNLDERIAIGFHSHNNLQLSFSNAQDLCQLNSLRHLIIDSSILGMGRGAGNLNTELIVQYLNANHGTSYDPIRILNLIDHYIKPISARFHWGYDAAFYLAAISDCHPNYASYLMGMQTLKIRDINSILQSLDPAKRNLFDKSYIQEVYTKYLDRFVDDHQAISCITNLIDNRRVLLLAPGKSIQKNKDGLAQFLEQNPDVFVIAINFIPDDIHVDMIFVSNLKRFSDVKKLVEFKNDLKISIVVTSNITTSDKNICVVNYSSYLNDDPYIMDNAGIMCVNLLTQIGCKQLFLAGFDGFSMNARDNYYNDSLFLDVDSERLAKINLSVADRLFQIRKSVDIKFLSPSNYDNDHSLYEQVAL